MISVIAKHLCGAGTDLALKSMETIRGKVSSCVLATCCHGICDWKEYVGRDYLRQAMAANDDSSPPLLFGPDEFDLMRQWCAGSVACQSKKSTTASWMMAARFPNTIPKRGPPCTWSYAAEVACIASRKP